jgi:hypothetical protein
MISAFLNSQNYEFSQPPLGLRSNQLLQGKPDQIHRHTNDLKEALALFEPIHTSPAGRSQTIHQTASSIPLQASNFSFPPAVQIGVGAVLVLSALGGAVFALKAVLKPPVPEESVLSHHQEFDQVTTLAQHVQKMDSEKFSGREFITYIRTKVELSHPKAKGLYKSIQFLKAATAAKRNFDQISVVETRYLGRKQQEFYRFVDDLLTQNVFGEDFRQRIEAKLTTTLPEVVNDQGRDALKVYVSALVDLSHFEYGLELLVQFKRYELSSYLLLRTINDLLTKFAQLHLTDANILVPDVTQSFALFEQLAPIIEMPKTHVNPEGFAKVFHFMVLELKQEDTHRQFHRFMIALSKWRLVYQKLQDIRRLYDPKKYRLPKEFRLKIPGENILEKYKTLMPQVLDSKQYVEVTYREKNDFGIVDFF